MTAAESDVPSESDAPKVQTGPARQTTAYLKKLFAQVGLQAVINKRILPNR